MKDIEIAMESQLSQLAGKLLSGKPIGLTIGLFHEDGFRMMNTTGRSGLTIAHAYLNAQDTKAYGVLFEGSYESPYEGASACILKAIVTKSGKARIEHIPFVRDENGNTSFLDRSPLFLGQEDFLKLYDTLDPSKYHMAAVNELVDQLLAQEKQSYQDFFVAMS